MEDHRGQFSISAMSRLLHVSASGYYDWRRRPAAENNENERLLLEIKTIYAQSKRRYGSPRIHRKLRDRGVRCGENRVARLMHIHDIRAQRSTRFKATTDSKHAFAVAQNILERQFEVDVANARWSTDITYISTRQGWLYLAVVMDLFSRRIVGWSMQETMARSLVINALNMALTSRRPASGLLHHSDRGSQYASGEYQALLRQAGCTCSMSRKGNC